MNRFLKSLATVAIRLVLYTMAYIVGMLILLLIFGIPPEPKTGGINMLGLFIVAWPVFAYLLWKGLGMGKMKWWE